MSGGGDGMVLWFAITVGALIAIGIGLDRWARYIDRRDKESWSEPGSFTSSNYLYRGEVYPEQEPTALEDTPVGAPYHAPSIKAAKPSRYKLCPACNHRNKQKGCKAILKTERRRQRPLRCNCSYRFHSAARAKKKRAA